MRALVLSLFLVAHAHAQQSVPLRPALALDEMQLLSAAPDAPYAGLGWRWGTHARGAVAVPIVRDPEGWRVRIDGGIEAYNLRLTNVFPFEDWRGLLAVRVSYRWEFLISGMTSALSLTGSIEHESDHESYHGVLVYHTFVYTDALALRGDLLVGWPELTLLFALTTRAHFASCTDVTQACDQFATHLSGSFEVALDASARTGGLPLDDGNLRACAALHLGYIAPVATIVEVARASLDVGACLRNRGAGEWQFVAEGRAGSDVGLQQGTSILQVGGSVRWVI